MTCREAQQMVMPYINHQLSDEELEAFLLHIEECPDCREELEIYFTVDYGIRQLDDDTGAYDIPGALKKSLEQAREHVHCMRVWRYSGIYSARSAL